MAWTNKQKQLAVRACREANVSDEQRRDMILRHFARAKTPDGSISSTSPKLNNADFEQFMAIVERHGGGKLLHFSRDYWQRKAVDQHQRMRAHALAVAEELERHGQLHPGGVGLRGWISRRVTNGQTDQIHELDYHGLLSLILGLHAFARQRGVDLRSVSDSSHQQGMESPQCEQPA